MLDSIIFVTLVSLIFILTLILIRESLRSRYLSSDNVHEILKYFGGSIDINQKTILKIEKDTLDYGVFTDATAFVVMQGQILEVKKRELLKNHNFAFQKPWRKDIEKALKQKYKIMKANKKENKKQEKVKIKEKHNILSKKYKQLNH